MANKLKLKLKPKAQLFRGPDGMCFEINVSAALFIWSPSTNRLHDLGEARQLCKRDNFFSCKHSTRLPRRDVSPLMPRECIICGFYNLASKKASFIYTSCKRLIKFVSGEGCFWTRGITCKQGLSEIAIQWFPSQHSHDTKNDGQRFTFSTV